MQCTLHASTASIDILFHHTKDVKDLRYLLYRKGTRNFSSIWNLEGPLKELLGLSSYSEASFQAYGEQGTASERIGAVE
jgi:hypothetical protein